MDTSTDRRPAQRAASRRAQALARLDEAAVAAAVRTGVRPRAVVGVLVVVLVVLGVLGLRVVLARSAARPEPLAPAVAPSLRLAAATPATPAPGTPTGTPASVLVHVVGQVRRPGVVTLTAGARVQDAVRAAGGATARADLAAVNLARTVVDGEQIVVPRPGESTSPAPAGPAGGAGSGGGASAPGGVVDLNAATEEQLDALPGIGPVLAGRIVAFRTEHGRFTSVDELSEVSGIGDALLERLRPQVRV